MGFCLFTAGAGLQGVSRMGEGTAGTPAEELERVVAMGGDTDTNAAVTGALLGAAVGAAGLPRGWLDRLIDREEIAAEAAALVPLAALTATR
jgi:ADP-ribosylglycohydrolase